MGAYCKFYNRLQKSVQATDAQHNDDVKQGETLRLVRELINRIKQLLSESQTPKCPTSAQVAAEEFQTQLGKLTEKYLDPLMKKMEEAMEKLPTEVKGLFKEIMAEFKLRISALGKPMQELTQEDLQNLLTGLKEDYEHKVKEVMESANKRFDAEPQDKEAEEQKANLEKLQSLMKRFEGKSQADALGIVSSTEFVADVEAVLGENVVRDALKTAIGAIDDITKFSAAAQCAQKLGVFGDVREL